MPNFAGFDTIVIESFHYEEERKIHTENLTNKLSEKIHQRLFNPRKVRYYYILIYI